MQILITQDNLVMFGGTTIEESSIEISNEKYKCWIIYNDNVSQLRAIDADYVLKDVDSIPSNLEARAYIYNSDTGLIEDAKDIETLKAEKIAELSQYCQEIIFDGIDFAYGEEDTKHFSLNLVDQVEIQTMLLQLKSGNALTTWHNDDGSCEIWSAEKGLAFGTQAMIYITSAKTRFNTGLRPYVLSLTDKEEVKAVTFDTELSAEVEAEIANIVSVWMTGIEIN